jgi:hypothetical protein
MPQESRNDRSSNDVRVPMRKWGPSSDGPAKASAAATKNASEPQQSHSDRVNSTPVVSTLPTLSPDEEEAAALAELQAAEEKLRQVKLRAEAERKRAAEEQMKKDEEGARLKVEAEKIRLEETERRRRESEARHRDAENTQRREQELRERSVSGPRPYPPVLPRPIMREREPSDDGGRRVRVRFASRYLPTLT